MKTKFEVGQKDASETLFILKCTQLSMENGKKLAFSHFTRKLFGLVPNRTRDAAGNYPTRATRPVTRPALNRDNYPYYP